MKTASIWIFGLTFLTTTLLVSTSVHAQEQQRRPAQSKQAEAKSMTGEKMGYLYATAYRNEIQASTTYGEIANAKATILTASSTYKYMFTKAMQAGVQADVQVLSGNGTNKSYFGLWGIFAYNLNQSWNNSDSYFIEVGAGMVDTALATNYVATVGTESEKKFSYMAMFGKYIPLWERIKYTPKAGIRKIGDLDLQFVLIPLNLTVVF